MVAQGTIPEVTQVCKSLTGLILESIVPGTEPGSAEIEIVNHRYQNPQRGHQGPFARVVNGSISVRRIQLPV